MVNLNDIYEKISEIKKEALDQNVPIMQDDTIDYITKYIDNHKVRRVLEIGTAVGYSAIMMALSSPFVSVVSVERDKDRYLKAVSNIEKMGLSDRITLVFGDALDVSVLGTFDLIIFDAAKGKNIEFFNKYEKQLELNGSIITDNINFHGFTKMDLNNIASRNVRGLVRKLRNYISFLEENNEYKTEFFDLGDGISVSERRF